VWIGAHATVALRRQFREFGFQLPGLVEKVLWLITLHPFFEDLYVRRLFVHLTHRHLVASPVVLGPFAVNLLRAGPSFGRTENDHRPERSFHGAGTAGVSLNSVNIFKDVFEGGSHQLVHLLRITSLDKVRRVAIAAEKLIQLLMTDAGQHTRVGDL